MNTDQIYNDFVANVLPKIQQGLSITKDYFNDFFGRFVKYLIIVDSITLVCSILGCIALVVLYVLLYKYLRDGKRDLTSDEVWGYASIAMIFMIPIVMVIISAFRSANDLILDLTVPEVRVYQEFKSLTNQ